VVKFAASYLGDSHVYVVCFLVALSLYYLPNVDDLDLSDA
jgi:hypothetical protein